jgi:hypothetical protein
VNEEVAMENLNPKAKLLAELERDGDDYFSAGKWNNIGDFTLSSLAVVASLVATVLAGITDPVPRPLVAAFAAVPAACASIKRVVDLRSRSGWYFIHAAVVRALARDLKYSPDPDLEEVARKRGEIEVDMEKGWSRVIAALKAPTGVGLRKKRP